MCPSYYCKNCGGCMWHWKTSWHATCTCGSHGEHACCGGMGGRAAPRAGHNVQGLHGAGPGEGRMTSQRIQATMSMCCDGMCCDGKSNSMVARAMVCAAMARAISSHTMPQLEETAHILRPQRRRKQPAVATRTTATKATAMRAKSMVLVWLFLL